MQQDLAPLVICGPSGVGKGTLIKRLLKEHSEHFGFSVSHTTRAPRQGEKDSKDYYFISEEEFVACVASGEFLEFAKVHGNLYGTSRAAVERVQATRKICVLDIDVQGVRSIKSGTLAKVLLPRYVFIAPPSEEALRTRLLRRGSEDKQAVERRLGNSVKELQYGLTPGNFDAVVVNDKLEQASSSLILILREWYPQLNPN